MLLNLCKTQSEWVFKCCCDKTYNINLPHQVYSCEWWWVCPRVVQPSPLPISRTFSSSQTDALPTEHSLPTPLTPCPWQPLFYFVSMDVLLLVPHVSGITHCLSIWVWLISLSTLSKFTLQNVSFLWLGSIYCVALPYWVCSFLC